MITIGTKQLPIYQETDQSTMEPGLYLCLFHGRHTKEDEMDEWGFNGPMIGPLVYVHTTYVSNLKIRFVDYQSLASYFPGAAPCESTEMIDLVEDMIEYQGKYYGDWTVFNVPIAQQERK